MTGTMLAGGLAWTSGAAGPAAAANGSAATDITNCGTLPTSGTLTGTVITTGTVTIRSVTATGTLDAAAGGLTGAGAVDAPGLSSGSSANIGPGTCTLTGPTSGGGGDFFNGTAGLLNVGANTFNNIGTLTNNGTIDIAGGTIGAVTTVNAGTMNVSGLSTVDGALTNSGLINLQNNAAGDRLTVTGNFTGLPGSRIALDFNVRTGAADQIVIGGSATGSTTLTVAGLAPGNPFTIGPSLVVVQGSTSPNAFTLGNAPNFGTLSVVLVSQTNGIGVNFAPVTIASAAGLSGSIATSAPQTVSLVSNNVAFERISDLRNSIHRESSQGAGVAATAYAEEFAKNDPISPYVRAEAAAAPPAGIGGPKHAVWIRGYGDYEQRDGQASFSFAGANFTSNLGYRQGTGGVMGGIDAIWSGLTTANDGLVLGLLGGYTYSKVELRDSPTTQVFSGPSVGAYGTYLRGNWFFDLLLKVDLLSLDINIPGMSQSASPTNYSAAANIGYRFDLPNRYYIEPTAGLDYVRTNFDHATALTATTVALNDGDALRARAGARIGTEWVTGSVRVEPSLLALAYEITEATNNALVINGTSISMPSDVGRVRGELQGLVNVINLQSGVSGFARVDTRFGEGLWSVGGKAGVRYQW